MQVGTNSGYKSLLTLHCDLVESDPKTFLPKSQHSLMDDCLDDCYSGNAATQKGREEAKWMKNGGGTMNFQWREGGLEGGSNGDCEVL